MLGKKKSFYPTINIPVSEFKKMEADLKDTEQTIIALEGVVEEWRSRYHRLERDFYEVRSKWDAACETIRRLKEKV